MRVPALGEGASQLPWLSPCAASLLAMARLSPAAAWLVVRQDPGAVLLVLRQAASRLTSSSSPSFSSFLLDPRILEEAARFLGSFHSCADEKNASKSADKGFRALDGFVDWTQPSLRPIYLASLKYARTAHRLAEMTGRCDPESAWITGLLLPLGWLVMSAVSPEQTAKCLADPDLVEDPVAVQQRHWALDQAALARRVLRRWTVPHWFAVTIEHLGLPVEIAQMLGAEPDHFQIIQLAVNVVQAQGDGLHLVTGADRDELMTGLGLKALEVVEERPADLLSQSLVWDSPKSIPFLPDLLALAAEILRLRDAPVLEHLEHERDELERALEKMRSGEAARLRAQKLQSLAEFAAGAAHEINNPLAVISGQAQYLLGHETDSSRQRSLQTIINQTQRVHQVLNDLMQFARPSQPQRQVIDVRNLVREALLSLHDCAAQHQVQVFWPDLDHPIHLYADPRQIRTALECLLRNAVEAAPPGGWARLRLETPASDHLNIVVEDSGTGPAQLDHIFDPFYSGRQAGRGRGLGLPTAWRLAREHGGDVRFDGPSGGPTRFVLSLPCHAETNGHASPLNFSGPESERSNGCHLTDVAL